MDGRADLHLHTSYSDGALSPRELIDHARASGLTIISATDHDHTGAIPELLDLGKLSGVEIISGVELSTTIDTQDIHLLGYFFDPTHRRLQEYLHMFRDERRQRAERIVGRLNNLGIPLQFSSVVAKAGTASIGRPHIAAAMVDAGHIDSYQEAFSRYLGNGRPAYERKYQIHPMDAIRLLSDAGGLSFVAHPGNLLDERTLLELIRCGVDGIEVIHPSHSPERVAYYKGIVEEYFLLTSGGSDFHGGKKNDLETLGRFWIPEDLVTVMKRRL
jgi:predicted metal-dependent phosphoesterase TrpH